MRSPHSEFETKEILELRVSDDLLLDAGTCDEVEGLNGGERLIRPPKVTLFHQVFAYLQGKPDPPARPFASTVGREGVAAAVLCLRWGSYLAVLLDPDKPVWPEARSFGTSRISDQEMARINIEASAALAEWIDLSRRDRHLYEQLVRRALEYLPMPRLRPDPRFRLRMQREIGPFLALANPGIALELIRSCDVQALELAFANVHEHPSRLFANTLLNIAWRNGPVENIHAGKTRGYPLDQRRITTEEGHELIAFSSERLALGLGVAEQLAKERSELSWPEQVLPFALARFAPLKWSLTEVSRDVRLRG